MGFQRKSARHGLPVCRFAKGFKLTPGTNCKATLNYLEGMQPDVLCSPRRDGSNLVPILEKGIPEKSENDKLGVILSKAWKWVEKAIVTVIGKR